MLFPAFTKIAADASAMKAISRVYSIRSWPCSSFTKRIRKFFIGVCLPLGCWGDPSITGYWFRDRAITVFSPVTGKEGNWFHAIAAEYDGSAVVVNHAPIARDLESAGQRESRSDHDSVDGVFVQRLLPVVLDADQVEIAFTELISIEV